MNVNNYHFHTTVTEFLSDEFFISSMLDPTAESDLFWQNLLAEGKISEVTFHDARQKLLGDPQPMDPLRKVELFMRIQDAQVTKPRIRNLYRYAAAIVLATVGASLWFYFQRTAISDNSETILAATEDSTGIRLVTNGDQTLQISGKEAVLDFSNAENVKLNTQTIELSKKEEAIQHEVHVPLGKRMSLVLPDGTKLWVNAGSSIQFPSHFAANKREVRINGEVYADVVKDPKKPFVFHTKEFDVQVLGTSLNIHAYEQDAKHQVTLVEGSVRMKSKAGEYMLSPDQAYFKNGQVEQVKKVDVTFFTSWKDGFYRFKDQPLQDVIHNLERYYGASIAYEPKISTLKCSGYLDLQEDLQAVLRGVAFSLDIQMRKENNTYKLYQKPM